MFMDITHYRPKRKGRRGPIPLDVPREASGRPSRSAVEQEHMVYFVSLEGTSRIKVGKTKNLKRRLAQYRNNSGCEPMCLAQLVVASAQDSLGLERVAIRYLQSKYERIGREWFLMPHSHLASAISEIVAASPVQILGRRGAPGEEREPSLTFETINEMRLVARHNRSSRPHHF